MLWKMRKKRKSDEMMLSFKSEDEKYAFTNAIK